jgi:AraC family transcriptional regulator, transcriptional activator of pobA
MAVIPFHYLQDRADSGLELEYFHPGDRSDEMQKLGAHRDDHYLFYLVEEGSATMEIDFRELTFREGALYYVLPGQVHQRIRNDQAKGWLIAVDASLVSQEQRQVFEQNMTAQLPVNLQPADVATYHTLLGLILKKQQEEWRKPFQLRVIYALLQAFTGMVAADFSGTTDFSGRKSRKQQLVREFNQLLKSHLKTTKSPAAYAEMLHVSVAYLNEALKKVTGRPVGHWIAQEVILEAKRLLYYTQLTVKEIAYELGYQDSTYFFRLFKQHSGLTPLAFRTLYHG